MTQIRENNDDPRITSIVIDDNKDIRDLFVDLLQMYNISVLGMGTNGQDAFELYQKHNPDIVFMDILMPNYDGFYGLEKIREYYPQAKIILVSGSTVDKTRLDNADVTGVIEKPIRIEHVLSIVDEIYKKENLLTGYLNQKMSFKANTS